MSRLLVQENLSKNGRLTERVVFELARTVKQGTEQGGQATNITNCCSNRQSLAAMLLTEAAMTPVRNIMRV